MGAMIIALCRPTGAPIQSIQQGALGKTLPMRHLWSIYAMRCYTSLDWLGFETDREPGRFETVG